MAMPFPHRRVITVVMAVDWSEKDAKKNQTIAPRQCPSEWERHGHISMTLPPEAKHTRSRIFSLSSLMPSEDLGYMYQDYEGWIQVPRHLLLVGIRVKEPYGDKLHPVNKGRHIFKIGDRGTCQLYTKELPEFIRVTPTWCDSGRGFRPGRRSRLISRDKITHGIDRTRSPHYAGLRTPSKQTNLRRESIHHDLQLFHGLDQVSSQRTDLAKIGVHEGLLDYMDTRMKDGSRTFFPKVRALWCKADDLVLTISTGFKGAGTYELFKGKFPTPKQLWNNRPEMFPRPRHNPSYGLARIVYRLPSRELARGGYELQGTYTSWPPNQ